MRVDPGFDLNNVTQCLNNLHSLDVKLTNAELLNQNDQGPKSF